MNTVFTPTMPCGKTSTPIPSPVLVTISPNLRHENSFRFLAHFSDAKMLFQASKINKVIINPMDTNRE
ncbi:MULTISPECIES: hypothetical protein [unclassified Acinetobacter]|uniref:hypothetical protein n=1 Tax=unclassified Acinetobacter TaxID=196816 RepID=UPI002574ACCB|nr:MULTISPECIES: hypothetical protein [unclassified Acinetobacter]MDM1765897.1 hypothetical protein [Acinetobacter sp. 226-1]MDM1769635.1 hypothetical protein [Acinetobacter sp. 226-4]